MADQELAVVESPKKQTRSTSGIKNFLAGGFGGICCVVSGHPLDTIKVDISCQIQYTLVTWMKAENRLKNFRTLLPGNHTFSNNGNALIIFSFSYKSEFTTEFWF